MDQPLSNSKQQESGKLRAAYVYPTPEHLVHLEASFAQSRNPDMAEKQRLSGIMGGMSVEKIRVSISGVLLLIEGC